MKTISILTLILCGSLMAFTQQESRPRVFVDEKPLIIKTSKVSPVNGTVFVATAYSLRGKTASGELVRDGIIAADPRVLPIGTIVYIEGMGQYIVKDTGGAIKGNRIDIWMPSTKNAFKFGKRKVKVTVVSKPAPKLKKKRK